MCKTIGVPAEPPYDEDHGEPGSSCGSAIETLAKLVMNGDGVVSVCGNNTDMFVRAETRVEWRGSVTEWQDALRSVLKQEVTNEQS